MHNDASTRPSVHEDVSAYTATTAEAAAILGRSEGTIRRLIREGVLPARQIPGARTAEYRLRLEDVHDVHAHMNAYASRRQRSHERVDALDASPQDSRPVRLDAVAGLQVVIDQAVRSAIEPLTAELGDARAAVERLATENGRLAAENGALREHLSALESSTAAAEAPLGQHMVNLPLSASHELSDASEDVVARDQLWAHLASGGAQLAATPRAHGLEAVPRREEPMPHRGLLARLLRRR